MFGIVNLVGNFGTVFCDQAYWQSSVAAKPLQVITYPKMALVYCRWYYTTFGPILQMALVYYRWSYTTYGFILQMVLYYR